MLVKKEIVPTIMFCVEVNQPPLFDMQSEESLVGCKPVRHCKYRNQWVSCLTVNYKYFDIID